MRRRKFNPGDEVCILPEWWDYLASGKNAKYNEYVQRGRDYVYIVDRYEDSKIYLSKVGEGFWSEDKLVPAFAVEESESEINIDDLI